MKKISFIKNKNHVIYAKESFVWIKMVNIIKIKERLKIIVITWAAHCKCNLNYKVSKNIPIIIHNASYDTHFIINQFAEEFKGKLSCIGENMEKYTTFSVPIKKQLMMAKQLHANWGFLIVLDLCKLHYQNLLITCLEFSIV